ncbi:IS1634 family transposase [Ferrimicrobium sp.]|uniref:IS1634 family transposase n=1 Tax=Ferrimicrobium sp. TaxID=2926050 RepID=UPI00262CF095|nr:IS1634 family transposase [Ferrimicrobium sp.]
MHVSHIVSRRGEKEYHSWLVRRSYRQDGKVKHETIANVSKLPKEAIEALSLALSNKPVIEAGADFEILGSKRHGAVSLLHALAKSEGLVRALDVDTRDRVHPRLALAMIIAQAIKRSSKLAMTKYLLTTTLPEDLGISVSGVDDYYETLDWLRRHQNAIESRLIRAHTKTGSMLLYDLSSSYMEGTKCPLSHYGYSRDKKQGKLQIEYGVVATPEGLPLAVRVFPGNTSDLASFRSVTEELKKTHNLTKIVIVGDRGMFSTTNIEELNKLDPSYLYVSALRSSQIRRLVGDGSIQLGLFDESDLFEITHPDYPGERLIACRNEALGHKRHNERHKLLEVATKRLEKVKAQVVAGRLRDPFAIGRRVEKALASTKMAKHIITEIAEGAFDFRLDDDAIAAEAALDGIYVIRTTLPKEGASASDVVGYYKNLANLERVFRSMKSIDINVRPIRHYLEDRVRAHVFACMLSAHLLHIARERLSELTFRDEEPPQPSSPVAKKVVSTSAKAKAASKVNRNGQEVMSFRTLLSELDTLERTTCRVKGCAVTFTKMTTHTPLQQRAFELIGAKLSV